MVDMVQYCQNDENELAFEDPALADDIEECITLVPPCSCSRCDPLIQKSSAEKSKFAGYSRINPLMHSGLTPHQRFLCCHRMRAFMFKLRQWSKQPCNTGQWIFANFTKKKKRGTTHRRFLVSKISTGFDQHSRHPRSHEVSTHKALPEIHRC